MAIPELIEMVPLERPVVAEVTVPGSKSLTNRALILAALADGAVTLRGALWSEDTQVMFDSLHGLGFQAEAREDPREPCNRTLLVRGRGGKIPNAGTAARPLELFVGNAGTAARFLAALVCLGRGVYRLEGTPRMRERPPSGIVPGLARIGLPRGLAERPVARGDFWNGAARERPARWRGGKFAVRLRPSPVRGAGLARPSRRKSAPGRSVTST